MRLQLNLIDPDEMGALAQLYDIAPDIAQEPAFPIISVIVTIVLLNVAWMYTFTSYTDFFSFRFFVLAATLSSASLISSYRGR